MSTDIDTALQAPGAITGAASQATVIEQTRAAAEVAAAVQAARMCPRDVQLALREMKESCSLQVLAERAFYSYTRAGSRVEGASVHLARELARIWGNFQHGIAELSRPDGAGHSEMRSFGWDVQANVYVSNTFQVIHIRDTKTGSKVLSDQRDIYENNANMGARRVRECIFAGLPPWFVEEAKRLCRATLEHGGGVPLPQRIARAIELFEADYNIKADQLEERVGRPFSRWSPVDLASLQVLYGSLQRRETTVEDEFPQVATTGAAIRSQAAAAAAPAKRATRKPAAGDQTAGEVGEQYDPADPTTHPDWKGGDA